MSAECTLPSSCHHWETSAPCQLYSRRLALKKIKPSANVRFYIIEWYTSRMLYLLPSNVECPSSIALAMQMLSVPISVSSSLLHSTLPHPLPMASPLGVAPHVTLRNFTLWWIGSWTCYVLHRAAHCWNQLKIRFSLCDPLKQYYGKIYNIVEYCLVFDP